MKKIVIPVAVVVVALAVFAYLKKDTVMAYFADGQKEIQTAFQAKAAATSFTMTTRVAAHEDNVMETHFYVSCPDRERITLKIASSQREMIRIGQRFYINEDGTWYFKDVGISDWSPCGKNPGLPSPWALLTEGRDLLSVFALASDKFKVQPAGTATYNGKQYRAWAVSMNHNGQPVGFKYTVMLDENHRPVLIALGQSSTTEYGDWDKPVTIEAPPNALPYPEDPQQPSPAGAHGAPEAR
jgi:hypothetical protein